MKDLDYYMGLSWSYRFEWDPKDNHYVASISELKGCKSCGETIQEALEMITDALKNYLETHIEFGDPIPEPVKPSDFKGNITYRTSPDTHYKLHQKAISEGKSINKIIDELINNEIA